MGRQFLLRRQTQWVAVSALILSRQLKVDEHLGGIDPLIKAEKQDWLGTLELIHRVSPQDSRRRSLKPP
jgi:hypothetical protein